LSMIFSENRKRLFGTMLSAAAMLSPRMAR
jgi:hypothetical protein